MRRVVSLYLPTWPSDRLQRVLRSAKASSAAPPDSPLVLIGRVSNRRLVTAADAPARQLGVRIGMAAAMAQSVVPGLELRDADPQADSAGLDRLALWALRRYSPLVAADPVDGLMIDITGAAHAFDSETALVADMVAKLGKAGVAARGVIAPTYGCAHAVARYGAVSIVAVEPHDVAAMLMPLPVEALRLPSGTADGLRRIGVERIGELVAMPRAPLVLRFGGQIGRRLDQAFDRASEPFDPVAAPEPIVARATFAEPIAAPETIARYLAKLVVELCGHLESRGLGVRKLDLLCFRVDAEVQAVRVGMGKPMRDVRRLTRLLCDRIETIAPGFGIEVMTLTAVAAEPLDYRASHGSLVDAPVPDISELIDTLANRIGDGRLYRVAPVESELPERSSQRLHPLAAPVTGSWPIAWPRPSRLLDPPERVDIVALLPDHPPAAFTWRGIRRRVRCADGPERVFGEWWERDAEVAAVRDYFQIEDEAGERFWLFRAGDGVDLATGNQLWFLQGLFG